MFVINEPIETDLVVIDYSGTIVDDWPAVYNTHKRIFELYKEEGLYKGPIWLNP